MTQAENPPDCFGLRPGVFLMTNSFDTGGSERQFVNLARCLESGRLRPQIGCIARQGFFLEGFEQVPEFPVGGNLYGIGAMQARFRLARHLRQSNIVVAQAFDFYTNLLLIPAAKIAGVPVVIGSQRQLGDLLTPAKFRAQLAVLKWCDGVVCNSRAAADRLIERRLNPEKIAVIGNGLAPSAFAPAIPAIARSSSHYRVAMIARMNSQVKNHRCFLRAAARIHCRLPGTQFLLAGDGPLKPELERFARELGIGAQVRFLGDRPDIPAILASVDVLVSPSTSESLSNAILESMAAGVPVIASNVGGNPELVTKDRGILFPVGDEDRLVSAIEHLLLDSTARADLGRAGKKYAESNFTIASMCRKHEELYFEALEAKSRRQTKHSQTAQSVSEVMPFRVAIVAASSRYVGGQSVQADLLLRNWGKDSEVVATLIPIDPVLPKHLRWVESVPVLRTIVRQPFYLWALWWGLRNVDVAHIFSASYWSFLIAPTPAIVIAHLRGAKVLIHYHSGEARDHLRRFRTARPILARADQRVVPSGYLVEVFREFDMQAQVVPNLVDLSQFSFRARNPIRPHLICTRGFHPYYGLDVVVRAFAEVKQTYPEARLDLVGAGPVEAEIRALVGELNLDGVSFSGIASRKEIGRLYDLADIFINGSCLDNMPVSVLEAFASGMPVASTSPEGIQYLIEHERTGLLSPVGDPHELAQSVVRLLKDSELSLRLVNNAHQQAETYRWEVVREQWLDVYRSLLQRRRAARVGTTNAA